MANQKIKKKHNINVGKYNNLFCYSVFVLKFTL